MIRWQTCLGLATEWIEIINCAIIKISPVGLGLATEWIEIYGEAGGTDAWAGLGLATEWIEIRNSSAASAQVTSRSCDRVD